MRIIGGEKKNLRIHALKNFPVRPTTDRTKESIFNILNNVFDFEELSVLDLFSGTGNMAYEFASRGAEEVIAVESFPKAVGFIRDTAKKLELDNLHVIRADVFSFIRSSHAQYDVVFADPPYDMDNIRQIHEDIFKQDFLKPGGWLIIEHSKRDDLSDMTCFAEARKYGRTIVSFFKQEEQ